MAPTLLVTPGDPRGIGPEVTLRGLRLFAESHPDVITRVVGPDGPLTEAELTSLTGAVGHGFAADEDAGTFAAGSIEHAVTIARSGDAHGIVTGPLHKPSLQAAGWDVPGQTEMLGGLVGAKRVGMLMAAESTGLGGPLRVLLATTHLPLRDAVDAISSELLVEQATLLHESLERDWAIDSPRVAMCALNPHASDGGLFGDEEARVYGPAVERLRELGVDASDPLPADTVFGRTLKGEFDAVLAPYHDVGMAAFKTAAFGSGVNVTLGLPFIRTSPDHGTAFDIAGTGVADASSMGRALELAFRLSKNRFDTPVTDV